MPILSKANISRAWQYMKRNGVKNTYYAAKEEICENRKAPHEPHAISEEEAKAQRKEAVRRMEASMEGTKQIAPLISILVPLYHTPKEFLFELFDSVRLQTYQKLELVLADAGEGEGCEALIREYLEQYPDFSEKINYAHLAENDGISNNTNQALLLAHGDYISLLDHDDILTTDCLFWVAKAIGDCVLAGKEAPWMLYTDEDKCNSDGSVYYENNQKPDFNGDYLLSNNYICHFLVLEASLFRELRERKAYDGAQDFDLVLRVYGKALMEGRKPEEVIVHIPEVLYHWRCHENSTAGNPHSKDYAYDAGQRALEDFCETMGWKAQVIPLRHKGFYRVEAEDIFDSRKDLGAIGGRVLKKSKSGKVLSGALDSEGNPIYGGMPAAYTGLMHRAVLTMEVEGLDLRSLRLNPSVRELFLQATGVSYTETAEGIFDCNTLPAGSDYAALGTRLGGILRDAGYRLLYDPVMETIWKR